LPVIVKSQGRPYPRCRADLTRRRKLVFYGQPFTPFGTTTTNNGAPRFSGHPFTKPMGAGTLDSTGLICSFHYYNLFLLCDPSAGIANKKNMPEYLSRQSYIHNRNKKPYHMDIVNNLFHYKMLQKGAINPSGFR
jgi:hypothetical protein